ncbi:hypothetical protein AREALGSMS7_02024 [Arenibacter algicola]|uniref:Uncharacterized protein n=1 Tax=Arenibacter algicola TaxID=616991 RepID=A0A221UW48_9FLAO|nr:hypothetical protein AREALGSMS7_02024 [Arenibacter algicola]
MSNSRYVTNFGDNTILEKFTRAERSLFQQDNGLLLS